MAEAAAAAPNEIAKSDAAMVALARRRGRAASPDVTISACAPRDKVYTKYRQRKIMPPVDFPLLSLQNFD